MKRSFLLSTAGLGLLTLPLFAEQIPMRNVRVTNVSGQATVKTVDHPKIAAVIDEETPLEPGDVIETGPKSFVEITMDGETVFTVQSRARLKLTYLYLRNTQLELSQGALLAKVKPMTDPAAGLILRLPTAVVAVRGTEFAAETANGLTHVGVFDEGHVAVAGLGVMSTWFWGPIKKRKSPSQTSLSLRGASLTLMATNIK